MIKSKTYTIIITLMLFFAVIGSSYAWFYIGDDISGITYSIAKIDSSVRLYKANDTNFNGVPDKLAATESAVYYMEQFSFTALGDEGERTRFCTPGSSHHAEYAKLHPSSHELRRSRFGFRMLETLS